jgi:hypothetical protein
MPKDGMPNNDTPRRKNDLLVKVLADIHRSIERLECHNKDRHAALLHAIQQTEERIMSQISTFADAVTATFNEIGASVDAIATSVSGVAGDVTRLKELIEKLQNNPGPISPEDQALLDRAQMDVAALATRVAGVRDAVAALDAATEEPPAPPSE